MKTKNILVLGLMAMATVALTGCSDSFLEEENPSADPVDEYYLTDAVHLLAESGAAALALCDRDGPPDLAIVDQDMPGMEGLDMVRRLRSLPAAANP